MKSKVFERFLSWEVKSQFFFKHGIWVLTTPFVAILWTPTQCLFNFVYSRPETHKRTVHKTNFASRNSSLVNAVSQPSVLFFQLNFNDAFYNKITSSGACPAFERQAIFSCSMIVVHHSFEPVHVVSVLIEFILWLSPAQAQQSNPSLP